MALFPIESEVGVGGWGGQKPAFLGKHASRGLGPLQEPRTYWLKFARGKRTFVLHLFPAVTRYLYQHYIKNRYVSLYEIKAALHWCAKCDFAFLKAL